MDGPGTEAPVPPPPEPSVLLLFVDGVGIGAPDPHRNPFFQAHLPVLRELLGGELPSLEEPEPFGDRAAAFPLDACLGMEGTPASGTGQVALLTGENAPRLHGGHFGPWTPVGLRPLLARANLLSVALASGASAAFANAYPVQFLQAPPRRWAAPPLAARAAGLLDRHLSALARGEAVASEIVNDGWRNRLGFRHLPAITPAEAGRNLVAIATSHRLTLFAHYATDLAGHRGGMAGAVEALERVDSFLGGVVSHLPPHGIVLMASDHGNLEELSSGHTRNPALGLVVWGEGREAPAGVGAIRSIARVAGAALSWAKVGAPSQP